MHIDPTQLALDVIVMHQDDNVGTALRDLAPGDTARFKVDGTETDVAVCDAIPFGHKMSIRSIPKDAHVVKYGEVIGRAVQSIEAGQHVHVHNIEGIRGRGDLQAKEANAG